MRVTIHKINIITPVMIIFTEFRLSRSFPSPTSGRKPNIPSTFTSSEPKFETKRVYSPVILGLNVVTKSFKNSFVLIIFPFGSRTFSHLPGLRLCFPAKIDLQKTQLRIWIKSLLQLKVLLLRLE